MCAGFALAPALRDRLGAICFGDPANLAALNKIMGRPITQSILTAVVRMWFCEQPRASTIVLDSPLLFESGLYKACNWTVAVTTSATTQLERLLARDGKRLTPEAARKRIESQWPQERKASMANTVLDNNDSREELEKTALAWWEWQQHGAAHGTLAQLVPLPTLPSTVLAVVVVVTQALFWYIASFLGNETVPGRGGKYVAVSLHGLFCGCGAFAISKALGFPSAAATFLGVQLLGGITLWATHKVLSSMF